MGNDATASAANPLAELIGQPVEVTSMEGQDRYVDVGTLESYAYPWVQLRKKNGELLCFPVHNIRIIKYINKG
jgi:hypothetical protein